MDLLEALERINDDLTFSSQDGETTPEEAALLELILAQDETVPVARFGSAI